MFIKGVRVKKKKNEIPERSLTDKIINNSDTCRLGLSKNNMPYIVPLSFGYDGSNAYFHTSCEGQKIDYINSNKNVCLEFENEVKILSHETLPCKWSVSYQSVICFGKIEEITDKQEMIDGLNFIMKHYSGKKWLFEKEQIKSFKIWKVKIEQWFGKQSGDRTV